MSPHHEYEPLPGAEDPFLVSPLYDLHELEVLFLLLARLVIDAFKDHCLVVSELVLHIYLVLSLCVDHHLVDLGLVDALFIFSLPVLVHEVRKHMLHHQELRLFPVI